VVSAGLVIGLGTVVAGTDVAHAQTCTANKWPAQVYGRVGGEAGGVVEPAPGASFTGTISWGDGATSPVTIGTRHAHRYKKAGTYQVTMSGSGVLGGGIPCSDTNAPVTTAIVYVVDARFTAHPGNGASARDLRVDGTASLPAGRITSYEWSFGDGASGSGATATHEYAAPGVYTVSLLVTDDHGQFDAAHRTVTVGNVVALDVAGAPARPKQDPERFIVAEIEGTEDGGGINPWVFAALLAFVATGMAGWWVVHQAHRAANTEQKQQLEAALAEVGARGRAQAEAEAAAAASKVETERMRQKAYDAAMASYEASRGPGGGEPVTDHRIEVTQDQVNEVVKEGMGPAGDVVEFAERFAENEGKLVSEEQRAAVIQARVDEIVAGGIDPENARNIAEKEYSLGALDRAGKVVKGTGYAAADAAVGTAEENVAPTATKKFLTKLRPWSWGK
jgi:PKD repeat protein